MTTLPSGHSAVFFGSTNEQTFGADVPQVQRGASIHKLSTPDQQDKPLIPCGFRCRVCLKDGAQVWYVHGSTKIHTLRCFRCGYGKLKPCIGVSPDGLVSK
jgi:hypothetical protein